MQLASQTREPDQRQISPTVSAALIDSLFEASGPLLAGLIFVSIGAALTALKTGEPLIWACVALLVVAGGARALDLRRYQARKLTPTAEAAERWQKRYQIGAKIQAAAIGIWCSTTLLSTDDAVAHMIALSVTTGIAAGGVRAGPTDGHRYFICRPC
jgi:hypothetical protein